MKITNFAEWKQAVNTEHLKLADVSYYLNEDGKERLRVFDTLGNLAEFCSTPEELLAWIESKKDISEYQVVYLESGHATSAIRALYRIVEKK